jgi:hypothetical protein
MRRHEPNGCKSTWYHESNSGNVHCLDKNTHAISIGQVNFDILPLVSAEGNQSKQ